MFPAILSPLPCTWISVLGDHSGCSIWLWCPIIPSCAGSKLGLPAILSVLWRITIALKLNSGIHYWLAQQHGPLGYNTRLQWMAFSWLKEDKILQRWEFSLCLPNFTFHLNFGLGWLKKFGVSSSLLWRDLIHPQASSRHYHYNLSHLISLYCYF